MPITSTNRPDVYRVNFPLVEAGPGTKTKWESEVVCLLRLIPGGMEVLYSHHVFRTRDGNMGPFDQESTRILPLDPPLEATIHHQVRDEFWRHFVCAVRPITNEEIEELRRGG